MLESATGKSETDDRAIWRAILKEGHGQILAIVEPMMVIPLTLEGLKLTRWQFLVL